MDLKVVCHRVRELSLEVGEFIRGEKVNSQSELIDSKSLNNFVTYVDKGAEERLVKRLAELIPESGFIAEEGTSSKKGEVYNWIVDPLDGTTNFIHDIPCYCISIALMRENQVVLGVVYEINHNECFYAWENSSAFLNKNEIHVSNAKDLNNSLLATGFPYHDYGRLNEFIELLKHLTQTTRGIRRLGSAAADLAYVACGRFEGFYEYGLSPWDVAAGAFIVQQAGGSVSDFKNGNDFIFGQEIIADNKWIHTEFQEAINTHF